MALKQYITAESLKKSIEWLVSNGQGCSHYDIGCDKEGEYNYAICLGFSYDGDDESTAEGNYADIEDGEVWLLTAKIGMQTSNSGMQCDFDIDWDEVDDLSFTIAVCKTDKDYKALATRLNKMASLAIREHKLVRA